MPMTSGPCTIVPTHDSICLFLSIMFSAPHYPVRPYFCSLAGLLTFLSLLYLPDSYFRCQWHYTSRPLQRGLQLQVQSRTLTGFPFIRRLLPPDCLNSVAKLRNKDKSGAKKLKYFLPSPHFFSRWAKDCICFFHAERLSCYTTI